MKGFLVLETGETFQGRWHGGKSNGGEVVFNTSHCGYEEIATDPSYYSQIMVMTAPMQGNYGSRSVDWESNHIWIRGFICMEIHQKGEGASWAQRLLSNQVPILSEIDTRALTKRLRSQGTPWGALVPAQTTEEAIEKAKTFMQNRTDVKTDWTAVVANQKSSLLVGKNTVGPRLAILDFGAKKNIVNSLLPHSKEIKIFHSQTSAREIQEWNPDGILLSNGPGDPAFVKTGIQTTKDLLGWKPIFGICMGHQVLSLALGASTYKLKFGHRGGNHPVEDRLLNRICLTSHNHGYSVSEDSLPSDVKVTHVNLNDSTVEGVECSNKKCFSVQFHPESSPGPNEASKLFNLFLDRLR